MRSTYRWQGAVVTDAEDLLLVKTTREAFAAVEAFVVAHHPYEVPEVVVLPLVEGRAPYLAWLEASVDASYHRACPVMMIDAPRGSSPHRSPESS